MSAGTDQQPLESVASALYGLPLGRFIPERTEQVREARTNGDRELAEAIGRLPKPTVAAWLVNLLTRERADRTTQLLDLGATLRQAQADLDPAALRELGAQRRRLVALVADEARDLAAAVGQSPGQAVLDEVAETLNAALVSEAGGTAVASGRLVKALPVEGIEETELDLFVAVPAAGRRRLRAVGGRAASPPATDPRREREREEARRAVEAAERAADRAARRAEDAAEAVQDDEQRVEARTRRTAELRSRIDELRRQLNDAEGDLQQAEDALAAARAEQRAGRRARDEAEEALEAARAAERRLG